MISDVQRALRNERELRSCMNDPAWDPQWDVWDTTSEAQNDEDSDSEEQN